MALDLVAELTRYGPGAANCGVTAEEARTYCRRLAQSHYENFTVVSRVFPRRLYQHLCNVYAYCRWADDLADEKAPTAEPLMLLGWWEQQLDAAYSGEAIHPVFIALRQTIQEFELPKRPLADLLRAFRRDQVQTRYETLTELLAYCEKSANPVGQIILYLGHSMNAENMLLSDSICTGLQLANFWQDVSRDFALGRIYIPQETCRRHGWDDSHFAAGKCDAAFRAMLDDLVADSETRLVAGQPLVERVDRDLTVPVRLFIAGGRAVLAEIRRSRYDVWSRRPTVGRLTKLWLLGTALLRTTWWRG